MSILRFIVCLWLLCLSAFAQSVNPADALRSLQRFSQNNPRTISLSGQFMVVAPPPEDSRPSKLDPAGQSNYVRLTAPLLAMTCERVKTALLHDLGIQDQWKGRIAIFLRQAHDRDEPFFAQAPDNRTYYISMPDVVERNRLIAAAVNLVLMEMANRNADRPAEIPFWLSQGLARQLVCEFPYSLVFNLPSEANQGVRFGALIYDSNHRPLLAEAHDALLARAPLTLDELSWPAPGQEEDDTFRYSAQLLVVRLLQMPGGPQSLCNFIAALPQHWNWQVTFLDAFKPQFNSQLEFQKWWALCVVRFTGRDLANALSTAESLHRLDDLLLTGALVRVSSDQLPVSANVTLQTIISDWSYPMQETAIRNKLQYLANARNFVSQDVVRIVDDYRQILADYVKQREKAGLFRTAKNPRNMSPDRVAQDTIRKLNKLDSLRSNLHPSPQPTQQARTSPL